MKYFPGQLVLVLDTTQKPAGTGRVEIYDEDTERCIVLFQYPDRPEPESILMPLYRLLPVKVG